MYRYKTGGLLESARHSTGEKTMVPRTEIRLYRLVREAALQPTHRRKTYWDRFPELKMLKSIGKRKLTSFVFFAYMFLFSTAEYTQIMHFGHRCLVAQALVTFFTVTSAISFEYGLKTIRVAYMIPFMSIVMGSLSCYVCLFALVVFTFVNVPPYEYYLLAFHVFLFAVTSMVTFTLAKCTDVLWQGFFTIIELGLNEGLVEKLRADALIEEDDGTVSKRSRRRVFTGRTFLIAEKKFP